MLDVGNKLHETETKSDPWIWKLRGRDGLDENSGALKDGGFGRSCLGSRECGTGDGNVCGKIQRGGAGLVQVTRAVPEEGGFGRDCSKEARLWEGSGLSGRGVSHTETEGEGGRMVAPEFAPISPVT